MALAHHREALAIDTEVLGARHPDIGRHLHNIAGVMRLMGQHKQAIGVYEQALALRSEVLGNTHQDVALTLTPTAGGAALAAGTVPDGPIEWACAVSAAADNKYVPANCRI